MTHSATKPILTLEKVSVVRGNQVVVRDVTATIYKKDIVAIIGPNGSGKSTLLKAMLGLLPYSGTIQINNKSPEHALPRVGYVPQRFSFDKNFPLTVQEFLHLVSKDQQKIDLALREVEMDGYKSRNLGALSGGQLQRVLIARALVDQPEILFLDEPTAGVDLEGEKDFYEIIQHQNTEHGVTVIMISHEVNVVYAYATQVLCLNRDLCCVGTPKEALTKEVLEQLYGSDAAIREHAHH